MNQTRFARFFIFLFLLIAVTAVFRWILLWRVQYSYMDDEFPWWMQQKDYVHTKGDKSEVLLLGDSRMKAGIIPSQLCENAYNLAVGGGTSVEMYYSLKAYLKNHPKPEKVIVAFGGFHYQREDCFKTRTLYFHFLPLKEELEAQFISFKLKQTDFPRFRAEIIDTLKYELLFPQKYSGACINSKFQREEYSKSLYQNNVNSKGQMFFGTAESAPLNTEANSPQFLPSPRINFYVHKIISLCNEDKIPLFITQLPMNENWEKVRETKWYKDFEKYFSDLEAKTGIPVETEIPCYEPECFGDSSHVNLRGAERFTAEIKAKYFL